MAISHTRIFFTFSADGLSDDQLDAFERDIKRAYPSSGKPFSFDDFELDDEIIIVIETMGFPSPKDINGLDASINKIARKYTEA